MKATQDPDLLRRAREAWTPREDLESCLDCRDWFANGIYKFVYFLRDDGPHWHGSRATFQPCPNCGSRVARELRDGWGWSVMVCAACYPTATIQMDRVSEGG